MKGIMIPLMDGYFEDPSSAAAVHDVRSSARTIKSRTNSQPTIKRTYTGTIGRWWFMGSSFWEEARTMCVGKYKRKIVTVPPAKKDDPKPKDEFRGPDTSSLTAFLLSLLSCTETSGNHKDDQTSAEDNQSDEHEGGSSAHTSRAPRRREGDNKTIAVEPGGEELRDVHGTGMDDQTDSATFTADDPDADWQLVSEKDLTISKFATETMGQLTRPESPVKAVVLPAMSEDSSLLSENLRRVIYSALPTLALGRQWVLLYSTLKHGISLRTLYRKAGIIPGPCLLIAGDKLGATFGGLISSPLKPTLKDKYQGTNDCFVFTNVSGDPKVFRSTGSNRYFVLCTNDSIAWGGGGHFALYLDSELLNGTSAKCETYGNSCLATTEEFVLKNVELWGFAHASRYVPSHASFKEPEETPGLYTW